MFRCFFPLFGLFFISATAFQEPSIHSDIFNGLKTSDCKSIVKYFNSTVNLALNSEGRTCNKFQAEQLLLEYFKSNKVASIIVKSNSNSKQGSSYFVYSVCIGKQDLQVIVKFMEIKGEASIVEFKIY